MKKFFFNGNYSDYSRVMEDWLREYDKMINEDKEYIDSADIANDQYRKAMQETLDKIDNGFDYRYLKSVESKIGRYAFIKNQKAVDGKVYDIIIDLLGREFWTEEV